jgi:hypothetical protein
LLVQGVLARHCFKKQPPNRLRSRWDGFLLAPPSLDRVEEALFQSDLNRRAALQPTFDTVHSCLHDCEGKMTIEANSVYEFDLAF